MIDDPGQQHNAAQRGTAARFALGIALAIFALAVVIVQLHQTGATRRSLASAEDRRETSAGPPASYRQVARIPTGFRQATAIALDAGGRLYAAGDLAVVSLDARGQRRELATLPDTPRCLAVGRSGKIFVGLRDHVEVFDGPGANKTVWPSLGARARLTSLAIAGDECWAADAGNRVVWRLDEAGRILGQVGRRDAAREIPGLVTPSPHLDVAAGRDGNLHVANPGRHLVETYTKAGDRVESWGESSIMPDGFAGCCNPTDIALFPDGRVATAEKGIPRVKIYGADGAFKELVAAPDDLSPGAVGLDLAIDGDGRICVLDPGIGAVRIFAPGRKQP